MFRQYYKDLCRYCIRFVKQEQIAEELVQDVFINLWQKYQQADRPDSAKAYLYTAVRNKAVNYLKSQFARQNFVNSDTSSAQLTVRSSQEALEAEELNFLILEAVELLPEQCKKIFELSRSGGFTYDEIANELKISPKTVENQISIALKKIKNHLHKYWDFFLITFIMLFELNGYI